MEQNNVQEAESSFYRDVIEGLTKEQKQIHSKYFYDERGSELFEQICMLEEYYPTDCEVEIMQQNIGEITELLGSGIQLIELGSGSSMKTRLLLDHIKDLAMYVPVDISAEFLNTVAGKLQNDYPDLNIQPVAADYTRRFKVPESGGISKRVVYFPGSTIGNLTRRRAEIFLNTLGSSLLSGDGLLIGVDLKKDRKILETAYNDSKGITAEFNKNILARINRELEADFDTDEFEHRARYNSEKGRIEMYLVSRSNQEVVISGKKIWIGKGETIHTENSYKYTIKEFEELASGVFNRVKTWTDSANYFSVHYFEKE